MPTYGVEQTASRLEETCVGEASMLCKFSGQVDRRVDDQMSYHSTIELRLHRGKREHNRSAT